MSNSDGGLISPASPDPGRISLVAAIILVAVTTTQQVFSYLSSLLLLGASLPYDAAGWIFPVFTIVSIGLAVVAGTFGILGLRSSTSRVAAAAGTAIAGVVLLSVVVTLAMTAIVSVLYSATPY